MALHAPDPPLTDGTVILRAPEAGDLPALRQAVEDAEIARWFGDLGGSAEALLEEWRAWWRDGSAAAFAVCTAEGGMVGHVLIERRNSGRAHVEYWLLPDARGQGLATRALRLASRWAIDELGIRRLELWTEPENRASQALAGRAGYRRDGVLRSYSEINGRRVDAVFYSLLPGELD